MKKHIYDTRTKILIRIDDLTPNVGETCEECGADLSEGGRCVLNPPTGEHYWLGWETLPFLPPANGHRVHNVKMGTRQLPRNKRLAVGTRIYFAQYPVPATIVEVYRNGMGYTVEYDDEPGITHGISWQDIACLCYEVQANQED